MPTANSNSIFRRLEQQRGSRDGSLRLADFYSWLISGYVSRSTNQMKMCRCCLRQSDGLQVGSSDEVYLQSSDVREVAEMIILLSATLFFIMSLFLSAETGLLSTYSISVYRNNSSSAIFSPKNYGKYITSADIIRSVSILQLQLIPLLTAVESKSINGRRRNDERFSQIRDGFGADGGGKESSLHNFCSLSDAEANTLIQRIAQYSVKSELFNISSCFLSIEIATSLFQDGISYQFLYYIIGRSTDTLYAIHMMYCNYDTHHLSTRTLYVRRH